MVSAWWVDAKLCIQVHHIIKNTPTKKFSFLAGCLPRSWYSLFVSPIHHRWLFSSTNQYHLGQRQHGGFASGFVWPTRLECWHVQKFDAPQVSVTCRACYGLGGETIAHKRVRKKNASSVIELKVRACGGKVVVVPHNLCLHGVE